MSDITLSQAVSLIITFQIAVYMVFWLSGVSRRK